MMYKVDNAIIMAAGLSSRFIPISYEKPKALVEVRGEILIERQIRQLKEKGIEDIIVVLGYKKEKFMYLEEKFGVKLIENTEYASRNNNSTIKAVENYLGNSYICSADNYFIENPFEKEVEEAYYSAVKINGNTDEWCIEYDSDNWIVDVKVGGNDAWCMLGHVFWTKEFSQKFIEILNNVYDNEETKDKLWETIYLENIDELKLKIKKYPKDYIYEFDSLDELREFDLSYLDNTRSDLIKKLAECFECKESDFYSFRPIKQIEDAQLAGFSFDLNGKKYKYNFKESKLMEERDER